MPLEHHDALIEDINQLLSLESNSVFAETYAKLAEKSIREAKTLQKVLNSDETALSNEFSHNYSPPFPCLTVVGRERGAGTSSTQIV